MWLAYSQRHISQLAAEWVEDLSNDSGELIANSLVNRVVVMHHLSAAGFILSSMVV